MISSKLLWRDWKSGRLGLIAASLTMAVAVVTAVALVADRVEGGLNREVSSFLAADLVVQGPTEVPEEYQALASDSQLVTANTAEFASMVFFGDANHLASVKAVSDSYPLRGKLTVADKAFAADKQGWQEFSKGPVAGEVWVEERLLPLLGINIGDALEVGEKSLFVSRVLIQEPDRGSGFSVTGARVMMNYQDLAETNVVQPGSRIRFSLLLASDNTSDMEQFSEQFELLNSNNVHFRMRTPEEAEGRLADTLSRGRSFLLLAGTVGLLLALVALGLSSQRYADQCKDQVALMKSWGISSRNVLNILSQQVLLLAVICILLGLISGWLIHSVLLAVISGLLPMGLPNAGMTPIYTATLTGLLCVVGFALPALWHLPAIAPLRVLRRDIPVSMTSISTRLVIGVGLMFVLLVGYSNSVTISVLFMAGVSIIAAVLGGFIYGLIWLLRSLARSSSSIWRLAVANLWRRRWASTLQSIAFSFTIMLLLVMVSMRTSLLDDWRTQIPADAPNHFLVNMMEWEIEPIRELMQRFSLATADWYPMVRGRLIKQNGEPISPDRIRDTEGLNRELNLTWAADFPQANRLVAGRWWPESQIQNQGDSDKRTHEFSMDENMASQLGVELGDLFTFSIGGREFDAELVSLREIDWDSMRPNFYIIFSPGTLENYSPSWITSTHLERNEKKFVNDLLIEHPTVLVIALDEIINRIRVVIDRVSLGLELMLLLILLCGILVLFAAVATSFDERARESAILRTLGSSRRLILGALGVEFLFMGFVSGLVAAMGAQAILAVLQASVFDMAVGWYVWLWFAGPVSGMCVIGLLGILRCYPVVVRPPLQSLRILA